jgi:hypothetical protein
MKCLSSQDLPSIIPLEAAYYWTLACRTAVLGGIKFFVDQPGFNIGCKSLKPARFTGTDSTFIDIDLLQKMQQNTMYYAHGKEEGQATHPVANLFFKTKENDLVLIDIAGGGKANVAEKEKNLINWIETVGRKMLDETLITDIHCIVLAPNVKSVDSSYNCKAHVGVVRGMDALSLLGGLQQISRWLIEEEEEEEEEDNGVVSY